MTVNSALLSGTHSVLWCTSNFLSNGIIFTLMYHFDPLGSGNFIEVPLLYIFRRFTLSSLGTSHYLVTLIFYIRTVDLTLAPLKLLYMFHCMYFALLHGSFIKLHLCTAYLLFPCPITILIEIIMV